MTAEITVFVMRLSLAQAVKTPLSLDVVFGAKKKPSRALNAFHATAFS
jgi:hypothetical protein